MDIDLILEKSIRESEASIRKIKMQEMLHNSYENKKEYSKVKIQEFVDVLGIDNVFVSTSGGKDSACLSDLCKSLFPDIKHVMFNTGLEYAATLKLAKEQGAEIIKPRKSWLEFCELKGYPVGSKHVSKRIHDVTISPVSCAITMFSKNYHLPHKWLHFLEPAFVDFPISNKCCNEFKRKPSSKLKLNPILGTRIVESELRRTAWKKTGCNMYSLDYKHGTSKPISLWINQDVDRYVEEQNIALSEIYTQYEAKRTGCVNCPYGAHLDGSRFDLLRKIEPKRYEMFMETKLRKILALSGVKIESDIEYMSYMDFVQDRVKEWHEQMAQDDRYLKYKIDFCMTTFSKEEMIKAVLHLYRQSQGLLLYNKEEIIKAIEIWKIKEYEYNQQISLFE